MLKVLMLGYNLGPWREYLREHVQTPIDLQWVNSYDEETVRQAVVDVDVVITAVFTPAMGQAARRLKLVQMPGAGYDKIHPDSIPQGCLMANCYEHEQGMAEWTIMMCLALSRKLIDSDAQLRQGDWSLSPVVGTVEPFQELGGKTMGVVGLGRVGRAVARLSGGFGMRRIGMDVVPLSEEQVKSLGIEFAGGPQDLDYVLRESDFVTVATPLLSSTRGLIGKRELGLMKPTAYIINPARAEIIDERSLFEVLRDGKIGGAGLDPWYIYPKASERVNPSRYPFHSLKNVVITPHASGWTEQTMQRRFKIVAANIDRLARGEPVAGGVPEMSRV